MAPLCVCIQEYNSIVCSVGYAEKLDECNHMVTMRTGCFLRLPHRIMHVHAQSLGILLHYLGHHNAWRRAMLGCLHNVFHLLHEVFASITPTQTRIDVATDHANMDHVVKLNRVVEQQDVLWMEEIGQGCVQLHEAPATQLKFSGCIIREPVRGSILVQNVFHLLRELEHQLHLLVLDVIEDHEVGKSIQKRWPQVPQLCCLALQKGERLLIRRIHRDLHVIEPGCCFGRLHY